MDTSPPIYPSLNVDALNLSPYQAPDVTGGVSFSPPVTTENSFAIPSSVACTAPPESPDEASASENCSQTPADVSQNCEVDPWTIVDRMSRQLAKAVVPLSCGKKPTKEVLTFLRVIARPNTPAWSGLQIERADWSIKGIWTHLKVLRNKQQYFLLPVMQVFQRLLNEVMCSSVTHSQEEVEKARACARFYMRLLDKVEKKARTDKSISASTLEELRQVRSLIELEGRTSMPHEGKSLFSRYALHFIGQSLHDLEKNGCKEPYAKKLSGYLDEALRISMPDSTIEADLKALRGCFGDGSLEYSEYNSLCLKWASLSDPTKCVTHFTSLGDIQRDVMQRLQQLQMEVDLVKMHQSQRLIEKLQSYTTPAVSEVQRQLARNFLAMIQPHGQSIPSYVPPRTQLLLVFQKMYVTVTSISSSDPQALESLYDQLACHLPPQLINDASWQLGQRMLLSLQRPPPQLPSPTVSCIEELQPDQVDKVAQSVLATRKQVSTCLKTVEERAQEIQKEKFTKAEAAHAETVRNIEGLRAEVLSLHDTCLTADEQFKRTKLADALRKIIPTSGVGDQIPNADDLNRSIASARAQFDGHRSEFLLLKARHDRILRLREQAHRTIEFLKSFSDEKYPDAARELAEERTQLIVKIASTLTEPNCDLASAENLFTYNPDRLTKDLLEPRTCVLENFFAKTRELRVKIEEVKGHLNLLRSSVAIQNNWSLLRWLLETWEKYLPENITKTNQSMKALQSTQKSIETALQRVYEKVKQLSSGFLSGSFSSIDQSNIEMGRNGQLSKSVDLIRTYLQQSNTTQSAQGAFRYGSRLALATNSLLTLVAVLKSDQSSEFRKQLTAWYLHALGEFCAESRPVLADVVSVLDEAVSKTSRDSEDTQNFAEQLAKLSNTYHEIHATLGSTDQSTNTSQLQKQFEDVRKKIDTVHQWQPIKDHQNFLTLLSGERDKIRVALETLKKSMETDFASKITDFGKSLREKANALTSASKYSFKAYTSYTPTGTAADAQLAWFAYYRAIDIAIEFADTIPGDPLAEKLQRIIPPSDGTPQDRAQQRLKELFDVLQNPPLMQAISPPALDTVSKTVHATITEYESLCGILLSNPIPSAPMVD